ncbi:MAG: hypothetical protein FWD48_05420 [Oscillospiraceae bacterium]|nr:hypothetical protein [Oscillospiraceae bacterium]
MNNKILDKNNWIQSTEKNIGLFVWHYSDEIYSSVYGEVPVHLYADSKKDKNDINQFNFKYILQVANSIDDYFNKAIESIKDELSKKPAEFGINETQIADYLKLPIEEFPVSSPRLMFYTEKNIFIQYHYADFPTVEYGPGIGVTFENDVVTSVEIQGHVEFTEEDFI